MTEPFWLSEEIIVAIHDEQLAIHGGGVGLREAGMLASALERPVNTWADEVAKLPELAASYAFGLAKTILSSTVTSGQRCLRSTHSCPSTMWISSSRSPMPPP